MEYKTLFKKVGGLIFITILLIFLSRLFVFYIPFLIAYIISLLVDPAIKWVNRKTELSRKTSSILVLATVFVLLIGLVIWGIVILVSESTHLLGSLNTYLERAMEWIEDIGNSIDLDKIPISSEIQELVQSTSSDILGKVVQFVQDILNHLLEYLKSIPTMLIYTVVTILATYFITSDKFYILDRLEHHIPKKILGKITVKMQKIITSLGDYLKAQIKLVGISFVIVLMGLNIFYLCGMNVGYPLLMALFIGFVDALPILGSGTVMIPWSIILFLNHERSVGFSILGLYLFNLALRQIVEPKIVSRNIGVHPIFTLIAMYTGFKFIGVFGMLIRTDCTYYIEKYI